MSHKQIKMKNGDTIVLESFKYYFSIEVDKWGCFIYHTETKKVST